MHALIDHPSAHPPYQMPHSELLIHLLFIHTFMHSPHVHGLSEKTANPHNALIHWASADSPITCISTPCRNTSASLAAFCSGRACTPQQSSSALQQNMAMRANYTQAQLRCASPLPRRPAACIAVSRMCCSALPHMHCSRAARPIRRPGTAARQPRSQEGQHSP